MGFTNLVIITAGILGIIYAIPLEEGITRMRCSIFESSYDLLSNSTWVGINDNKIYYFLGMVNLVNRMVAVNN